MATHPRSPATENDDHQENVPVQHARLAPGAEARGFISATSALWPKDLHVEEEVPTNGKDRIDLVLSSRKHPALRFDVKRLGRPGSYPIESAASRAAIWMKEGDHNALFLIVPELSKRTIIQVEQSLARVRRAVELANVMIFSHRGGHLIFLDDWDLASKQFDAPALAAHTTADRREIAPAFSEANQQLLKSILFETVRAGKGAAAMVESWWPRHPEQLTSVERWAEAAGVGRTTAYRLYQHLRGIGWITEVDGITPLRLTNLPTILSGWIHAARSEPPQQHVPIAPLYLPRGGAGGQNEHVMQWIKNSIEPAVIKVGGIVALTGWKALDFHCIGIVVGKKPITIEVPIERYMSAAIEAAVPTNPKAQHEPWAYVGVMRHWRSAVMGVTRRGTVPPVDPWQAALDVAGDPNRGFEQAEAVARKFSAMAGQA